MTSTRLQPRNVQDDPARGEVVIPWTDGHVSRIPYQVLRGWCPCAVCQGHGGQLAWVETGPVTLFKVEPVGAYGAQFYWSDMHNTGIYRFDYLRELCCCAQCSAQRGGARPTPRSAG